MTEKELRALRRKVGRRIRELRKAQQLTQSQLAFEAKIGRDSVAFIELGDQNPTLDSLARIASALGVGVEELFVFPKKGE